MTSFLGPENPPPLSLISEINQHSLRVSKVRKDDENVFDYGDEYYSQMCKLFRLQVGINIDDKICVVSSMKSKVANEIERRLCLIHPILTMSLERVLYEEVSGERDIKVGMIHINAENYFSDISAEIKFDKVIILDGIELVKDRNKFLRDIKNTLNVKSDGSLVIIHRTKDMLTLPVYFEAINDFKKGQIEIDELLSELLTNGFLVGWNIVSLPIQLPKAKWFNQLYNHFPPIMENIHSTDIFGGLRELVDTSFKYADYIVTIKDRFLFLVSTLSECFINYPYKMHLFDNEIESTSDQLESFTASNLLRLKVTPEIRSYLPKNINDMSSYLHSVDKYPEEWWGTMAKMPSLGFDRSRINYYIQPCNKN